MCLLRGSSEEEEKRAAAPSAADLEDDLVGGKIPRTLLKVNGLRGQAVFLFK